MIRNIPKPKISPNFTIADIHKIREWNYERLKNSTSAEREYEYKQNLSACVDRLNLFFDQARNCYVHYPQSAT